MDWKKVVAGAAAAVAIAGGTAVMFNQAANAESSVPGNYVVRQAVDVGTDTVLDTARAVVRGEDVNAKTIGRDLLTNTLMAGAKAAGGNGIANKGADNVYANKNFASGDDWNNYFKDKYGRSNVHWNTAVNSTDDILDTPSITTRLKPEELADVAKKSGWRVEPLGKGSKAGLTYEQGDGFTMRAPNGASEYMQYHPGGGRHGELPYYKISSGKNGTVRYFIEE